MSASRLILALPLLTLLFGAPAHGDELGDELSDARDCAGSSDLNSRILGCTKVIIHLEGDEFYWSVERDPRFGDRGREIEALQSFLARQGFAPGELDGVYGPATHRALLQASQRLRISVKGVISLSMKDYLRARAYYRRGLAYANKGDNDRAIADYDKAIQLRPDYTEANANRDRDLQPRQGDPAIAQLQRYLSQNGFDPGPVNGVMSEETMTALNSYNAKVDPEGAAQAQALLAQSGVTNPTPQQVADAFKLAADARLKDLAAPPAPPPDIPTPTPQTAPLVTTVATPQEQCSRRNFTGGGIEVTVSCRDIEGQKITFVAVEGEFGVGDDRLFKQALLTVSNPVAIVSLTSPGGDLDAGMEIGRTIWTNQYRTVVENGVCASACALAWLAGRPRYAASDASIGFHAPTRLDDPDRKPDSVGSAFVGGYLTEIGFTATAIEYITERTPDEMNWLTSGEASDLGIYVEEWND